MSPISSFVVVSGVVPEPKIFLCVTAFAVDAAAVNPNETKLF